MSGTMGCDRLLENFPQITSGQTYKIYNQHMINFEILHLLVQEEGLFTTRISIPPVEVNQLI